MLPALAARASAAAGHVMNRKQATIDNLSCDCGHDPVFAQRGLAHDGTMNGRVRGAGTQGTVIGLSCMLVTLNAHAQFVPKEQLVSPQREMIDAEFSQSRAQITWCDSAGKLWLANVDPVSGYFKPVSGKGVLIDSTAMSN